jgi:ankyrin repeat protein
MLCASPQKKMAYYLNALITALTFCSLLFLLFPKSALAEEPEGNQISIVEAAKQKDWEGVSKLLATGSDVNVSGPDGMTALHWATLWGADKMALQLIAAGADVSAATVYEVTPLQIASMHGRTAIATQLLKKGADAKARFISSETVLMQAARTGDDAMVNLLLESGAEVNAHDQRGQTALMWAAAEGHVDVVARLLASGANIDTTLDSGFTALAFAAREGRSEVAEQLIKAGADVNQAMKPKNSSGRAPREGMSPLLLAVESGHFELALRLIELGADPNDQRSGYAPLHAISWVRKPNRGDDVDGDPAPRGSGSLSSLEFVRALVEQGADVNLQLSDGKAGAARLNPRGGTPLLFAARTADLPLLQLLVELGGDINIANEDGCTPLMAASGVGVFVAGEFAGTEPEVLESISYLHQQGADLDTIDQNGETAMHGAAYRSFPAVVDLLVELGASPSIWEQKNKLGSTPLQVAQGKRPGSFKPDKETIRAIRAAMKRANAENEK